MYKVLKKSKSQEKITIVGTKGFFDGVLKQWEDDPTGVVESSNHDLNERRRAAYTPWMTAG
jgi:hypothetical protein